MTQIQYVKAEEDHTFFLSSIYLPNNSKINISIFRYIDVNYLRVHSASVWQISVETSCISLLDSQPNPDSATASE